MDNAEMLMQIAKMIEESEERTANRISKIDLTIENNVTKKIEALFDGYKLTHEKQWELER